MAKIWTELSDPDRHVNYMDNWSVGGRSVQSPRDNLLRCRVLLVEVCSFTFQFHSRQQLEDALQFFSRSVHPTSRLPGITSEHYWHPWCHRLPKGFTAKSKRLRILAALQQASGSMADDQAWI